MIDFIVTDDIGKPMFLSGVMELSSAVIGRDPIKPETGWFGQKLSSTRYG